MPKQENDPWVRMYNHLTSNLTGGVRIFGIPVIINLGLFTPENREKPKRRDAPGGEPGGE